MTQPKPQPPIEAPEAPAIVTPLHVLRRPATDKDMKPITGTLAWSKLTVFQKYAAQKSDPLSGGSPKYSAADRSVAGETYTKIFDTAQPGGRDSSQGMNISRGTGGNSGGEARSDASRLLAAIESRMGHKDRNIIEMVCGKGHWPSEAVREACNDFEDTVSARFREALDGLCDAMEGVRLRRGFVGRSVDAS